MHKDPEFRNKIYGTNVTSKGQQLYDYDYNQVASVRIKTADGTQAVYEWDKEKSIWNCTSPYNDRAVNINSIIQFSLDTQIQEEISTRDVEFDTLGLGENSHHIEILDQNGAPLADFHLGSPSAWNINIPDIDDTYPTIYIRKADEPDTCYLCDDLSKIFHRLFEKELIRLRDTLPVNRFLQQKLLSIRISKNGSNIIVGRTKGDLNRWEITKPLELKTDPEAMNRLLGTIYSMYADKLLSPSEVTLPENDSETIEMGFAYLGNKEEIVLKIYPSKDPSATHALATISDRPEVVFALPTTPSSGTLYAYTSLPNNVNDIRSRNILTIGNVSQIDALSITGKNISPIRLSRKYQKISQKTQLFTDWEVSTGPRTKTDINPLPLDQAFIGLMKDRIVDFVTDAATDIGEYGLDNPSRRVDIIDRFGNIKTLLMNRNPETGIVYGSIAQSNRVWKLSTETYLRFKSNKWDWRSPEVWDFAIAELKEVVIWKQGFNTPMSG